MTAIALTMWFWLDLWLGGGLIGGDIYTYYFPQKAFYAEQLAEGILPTWNNLVGHGYPLVAESQTGVYYPPNVLLYSLLKVNTAYNISHLLHYVVGFAVTALLALELGLSLPAALLASLAFIYGWFAPRSCLEWAIVTGIYLPLNLWLLIRFFRSRSLLWLWLLAGALCLQLLPGHYHLAFITLLTLAGWSLAEVFLGDRLQRKESPTPPAVSHRLKWLAGPAVAVTLGFILASVQLLPTWSLKQNSQRETSSSADFDPGYGHIPPRYISQMIVPWVWYADAVELSDRLNQKTPLDFPSATNPVEAHLYFGFLPCLLAIYAGVTLCRPRNSQQWSLAVLGVLGLLAAVYATGWLIPWFQHLPGFGFFRGSGRFGLVTTLAAALWAGFGLDQLRRKLPANVGLVLFVLTGVVTLVDLSLVSQRITYAFMVAETPLTRIEDSPVRQLLKEASPPARLFAPGPNLPTITGIAATPVYLGLGPEEYFDPELNYPVAENESPTPWQSFTPEQIDWLRRAGVTHILGFSPPNPNSVDIRLVWQGIDPLLNGAWGRPEPIYLSEVTGTRGRVAWEEPQEGATIEWNVGSPHEIELTASTPVPQTLILTELFNDDWLATVDGQAAPSLRIDGMFRGVEVPAGKHQVRWSYEPAALRAGSVVSIAGITIWLMLGGWLLTRRRRPIL
ncbi:YfhO family protein [Rubinisphaera sp. ICM_H10]|nr:YfhO family protein [Rubinisphaera margarita]